MKSNFKKLWMAGCLLVILLCVGFSGCSDDDDDVQVPKLSAITMQDARDFMAYARTLQTQTVTGEPRTVAWSMANQACQERAMAMEYAAAIATLPINEADPPILREEDITDAYIAELAENPGIEIATINITGPLIAEQTFVDPDGTPVEGDPWPLAWSYHHAAVVNVEGKFMVVDLSTGDEPMTIDEWAHSFIPEDVGCYLMDEDQYMKVWSYWLSVMSNFDLPKRPSHICGYTITPIFRFRWDQDPIVEQIRWTPSTLETQCDAFKNVLAGDYGITVEDAQVPYFTSLYEAQPEETLCEWMDLKYCE